MIKIKCQRGAYEEYEEVNFIKKQGQISQAIGHQKPGCDIIVFVWTRNGSNRTKAFVKGLLAPEMKTVGGATG